MILVSRPHRLAKRDLDDAQYCTLMLTGTYDIQHIQ
jgi:hypothetical protein